MFSLFLLQKLTPSAIFFFLKGGQLSNSQLFQLCHLLFALDVQLITFCPYYFFFDVKHLIQLIIFSSFYTFILSVQHFNRLCLCKLNEKCGEFNFFCYKIVTTFAISFTRSFLPLTDAPRSRFRLTIVSLKGILLLFSSKCSSN